MRRAMPLTAEEKANIQQELAQLATGIGAMKVIQGYEIVVQDMEARRTELRRKLRARIQALQAAAGERQKSMEDGASSSLPCAGVFRAPSRGHCRCVFSATPRPGQQRGRRVDGDWPREG